MTRIASDAVLRAIATSVPLLPVYDGVVTDSDLVEKTVSAPLPYAVFYFGIGTHEADNLAGASGALLKSFQVTCVGEDRTQAEWVSEKVRGVFNRKMVNVNTVATPILRFIRRLDDQLPVRRDDEWSRPGGAPLFYCVDRYEVLI